MKKISRGLLTTLCLAICWSLLYIPYQCCKSSAQCVPNQQRQRLTVFVHGTTRPFLSISDIFKVLNGTTHNSLYKNIVHALRTDPYFYQSQPIQQPGFHKIQQQDLGVGKAANLVGHIYDLQYQRLEPGSPQGLYYTFGWSGLLSVETRRTAAEQLYDALQNCIATMPTKPIVQVIGYSHGGNVALYLAEVEKCKQQQLFIDDLILIGTPVQNDTDYLVNSEIFGHTYNIYSTGDLVQTVDFLSSSRHSLGRHAFKDRADFYVPDNLTQIRVRVIAQGKKYYGQKTCGPHGRRTFIANPGHTELWFFGWAMEWYRKTFPLYPLAIIHFIPDLLAGVQRHRLCGKIRADFHVDRETLTFYTQRCQQHCCSFIPLQQLHEIGNLALQYKPAITEKEYKKKVKKTIKQAKVYYRKQQAVQCCYEEVYSPIRQRQIARKSLMRNC